MTRAEAKEIIKSKAPNQYHGTALGLLSNLTDASFGPDGPRHVTFKDTTLMKRLGIGDRQMGRILERFSADGLGTFIRKGDKIAVTLNLTPLMGLPDRLTKKGVKADRARKAREAYAAQKQERNFSLSGFLLAAGVLCGAGVPSSEVFA